MGGLIFKAFLKLLEKRPELVEELVEEGVKWVIKSLREKAQG